MHLGLVTGHRHDRWTGPQERLVGIVHSPSKCFPRVVPVWGEFR